MCVSLGDGSGVLGLGGKACVREGWGGRGGSNSLLVVRSGILRLTVYPGDRKAHREFHMVGGR